MKRTVTARVVDAEGVVSETRNVSSDDPNTLAGFIAAIADERPGVEVTFIVLSEQEPHDRA